MTVLAGLVSLTLNWTHIVGFTFTARRDLPGHAEHGVRTQARHDVEGAAVGVRLRRDAHLHRGLTCLGRDLCCAGPVAARHHERTGCFR